MPLLKKNLSIFRATIVPLLKAQLEGLGKLSLKLQVQGGKSLVLLMPLKLRTKVVSSGASGAVLQSLWLMHFKKP